MSKIRLMAARSLLAAMVTLEAGVLPIIWNNNEKHQARYMVLTCVTCAAMVWTVHTAWKTRKVFDGEKAIALPFKDEGDGGYKGKDGHAHGEAEGKVGGEDEGQGANGGGTVTDVGR